MTATRRRARALLAAFAVAALGLTGAGVLALAEAPSASADPPAPIVSNINPIYGEVIFGAVTQILSGTGAEPGAQMQITVNGNAADCDGTVANASGDWNCYITPSIPESDHNHVSVSYLPIGGPPPSAPALVDVRVDLTVTAPTITVPASGGSYITTDPFQTVGGGAGSAEPGAAVTVGYPAASFPFDFTVLCSTTANPDGSWGCQDPGGLQLNNSDFGSYSLQTEQVDLAGNDSGPPQGDLLDLIVKPAPPSFAAPTPGFSTTSQFVTFSLPSTESLITLQVDGVPCPLTLTADNMFEVCTAGPLAVGNHTATAKITLHYSGEDIDSPTVSVNFTILAVPPASSPPPPSLTPTPTPTPPPLTWTLIITDANGNDISGQAIKAGQTVILSSTGLPPGSTVDAELHSNPVTLGSVVVGPSGTFKIKALIPRNVPAGSHHFVVTLTPPGASPDVISAGVPIVPADPDPVAKDSSSPDKSAVLAFLAAQRTGGFDAPTSFSTSLKPATAISVTPVLVGVTGLLASAFVLLVAFPAELLDSTISGNYDRVFGWTAPIKRRLERLKKFVAGITINRWAAVFGITALAALILGFADPGFAFNGSSLRLWVAIVVSLLLVNVVVSAVVMRVARRTWSIASTLDPMPATLLLVALSVIVSRAIGIQPGFLFGVVLGVNFAVELGKRRDALLALLSIGATIVVGMLSWVGYTALVVSDGSNPGFWHLLVQECLSATTIEALATMTVALLPLQFLDGRVIFDWNKWAWAGAYLVALVILILVIVPLSDNWGTMSAPLAGWGVFFAGFAVLAVGIWAVFRYLPVRNRSSSDTTSTTE
jgi:hypothetical protein